MKNIISIGSRRIGEGHPPLLVAEMSGNHHHSLERAFRIVEAAARAGAHALKLQTYTPDTMTIDSGKPGFRIDDPSSLWFGHTLYDLYRKAQTPWEWHEAIFLKARKLGLVAFSTPFDATAVDFLETLEVPCYKVSSFENTDLPLLRKVAQTGKPVLLSTGMASVEELEESVACLRDSGCRELVLLKCTSTYPADPAQSHLRTLQDLAQRFSCLVGLSDHTAGSATAAAAVALGACVVEKHLTLARDDGAVDSAFSLNPEEFRVLCRDCRQAFDSLGKVCYGATGREQASRKHRRSLYAVRDIAAGEPFSFDNIRAIRPGHGLPPKYLEALLGRPAPHPIAQGEPLTQTNTGLDNETGVQKKEMTLE